MKWKLFRKQIEKKVIDPFKPENIIQALKNNKENFSLSNFIYL